MSDLSQWWIEIVVRSLVAVGTIGAVIAAVWWGPRVQRRSEARARIRSQAASLRRNLLHLSEVWLPTQPRERDLPDGVSPAVVVGLALERELAYPLYNTAIFALEGCLLWDAEAFPRKLRRAILDCQAAAAELLGQTRSLRRGVAKVDRGNKTTLEYMAGLLSKPTSGAWRDDLARGFNDLDRKLFDLINKLD